MISKPTFKVFQRIPAVVRFSQTGKSFQTDYPTFQLAPFKTPPLQSSYSAYNYELKNKRPSYLPNSKLLKFQQIVPEQIAAKKMTKIFKSIWFTLEMYKCSLGATWHGTKGNDGY